MQIQEQPEKLEVASAGTPVETDTSTSLLNETILAKQGFYRFGLAYGRVVYRLRWLFILLWLVGLGASIPFTISIGNVLNGGDYSMQNSESSHVSTIMSNTLHQNAAQLIVVFQASHMSIGNITYQQEVNSFVSKARMLAHITSVNTQTDSRDGRTAFVVLTYNTGSDYVESNLAAVRQILPLQNATNPAHAYLTGGPAIDKEFSQITSQDVEHAEFIALPISLLVLLLVFNSLIAALLPIVLAMVAVPSALAVIYFIGSHMSTSIFVLNVASIIGLGISIDYSLFMTRRYREELARGRSRQEAIAWTISTAGVAILFSGMTVMIGFIGLLLVSVEFMASFGLGGAVVVCIAVLAALTLLPSLLSVLGPHVNSLRIPGLKRAEALFSMRRGKSRETQEKVGFWGAWAEVVMRRPILVLLITCALLAGMGWPIFSINMGQSQVSALPTSSEARQGYDILNAQFPADNSNPVSIIAQAPGGSSMLTSTNLSRLDHLTQWLETRAHVTNVTSLTHLPSTPGTPALSETQLAALYSSGAYKQNAGLAQFVSSTTRGNTTLITVDTNTKMDSPQGKALINQLRAGDKAAGEGLTVLVGGEQASSLDFTNGLYSKFPVTVLFILLATYIILLFMFRSVLLPLKAVLMNVLSVCAALGLLVFIFQWGNLSNILDFTASGFIDTVIPALMFCILFGLSMDYEVFLLSRIREEWLRTHDNRQAVACGLEKTGGVITNAALLFVIVTAAFIFTRLLITKEMGLGMALAVFVDATIIRSLLVPATMRLLGRWNWWFPFSGKVRLELPPPGDHSIQRLDL